MVVAGPWLSALYVIGVMIVGIFMILNLFLALLLSNLDQLDETDVYPTSSEQAQEARHDDDDEGHDHDHASSRDPAGRDGSLYLPKQSQQYAAQNHGDWLGADGRCDDTDSLIGVGTEQDEHTRMIKPSPRAWSPGAVSHSQASEPGLVKTAFYGGTVVPLPPILAVPLNPPDMNKARRRASLTQGHFAWGMEHSRSMMPDGVLPNSQLLQATSLDVPPGPQSPEGQQARLEGNSLFLLSPTNPIRVALYQLVTNKWFDGAMLVVIVAASLALCFDDASAVEGSTKGRVLYILDIVFCALFGIEALLKILAYGLIFNGPHSYMRSGWNLLDLLVVSVQVLVLVLEAVISTDLTWLRAFQAVRALRPIRVAARIEGIRVVVVALGLTLPAVSEVILVASLFYFIFAVLGVELFMGKFFLCSSDGEQLNPYYLVPSGNINRTWCEANDGSQTITSSYYHSQIGVAVPPWTLDTQWGSNGVLNRFDNVIMAIWVLIQMATLENWAEVMYQAMQTTQVNEQPLQGANDSVAIYFVVFIIFCSFFILNLVIGVSIDKFNRLKKARGGRSLLLTDRQQDWLTIQRMMATTKPKARYPVPSNALRRACYHVALSNTFDKAMVLVIIANIVTMCMTHEGMSERWKSSLMIADVVFTGIYVVEMGLKQAALGFKAYFQDAWCIFDFIVVVTSVAGVILDYSTTTDMSVIVLLRVLRVLRIIKLIPKARGLQMLMTTLLWSLPALGNVAAVLLMFMFIYAIIGMNLFGHVKLQEALIFQANFQDFPTAMLLLFRMTTVENWNSVMFDCMQMQDCIFVSTSVQLTQPDGSVATVWEGTYLDSEEDAALIASLPHGVAVNQCSPAPALAAIYFVTYMMFVVYLMVQLVIGIILENIETHARIDNMKVKQQHIQDFLETWEDLDPKGTSYIPVASLTTLLHALETPVGVKGASNVSLRVQAIVQDVNIPIRVSEGVQSVHFMETLHALAGRIAGQSLPAEEEFTIHKRMVARLPKDEFPPKYSVGDFYAALNVKAYIQGFLVRRQLQPIVDDLAEDTDAPSPINVELSKPGALQGSRKLMKQTTSFFTGMFRGNKVGPGVLQDCSADEPISAASSRVLSRSETRQGATLDASSQDAHDITSTMSNHFPECGPVSKTHSFRAADAKSKAGSTVQFADGDEGKS